MNGVSRGGIVVLAMTISACVQSKTAPIAVIPLRADMTRATDPIRSWRELRDQNVVRQQFDYSCGAAALATLMRFYFGYDVSEETILSGILARMPGDEVRDRTAKGLSLLDLKLQAERMGFQAAAVRLNFAALPKLQGPIVIHLQRPGYNHFAILRGVRGDRVYLADPSRGNVRLSIDRFAQEWSGIALVLGRPGFGLPQTYPLALDDQEHAPNETLAARRSLYSR